MKEQNLLSGQKQPNKYWQRLPDNEIYLRDWTLVSELVDYLYSGRSKELLDIVKLARLLCDDDERRVKVSDLANYIESNFDGLYGSKSLKNRVEVERVLVSSSSAMEKNIDIVGRRFKKQGMNWTKEEASNLLKLRILCHDKNGWGEFWQRQKLAGVSFSTN
jgi:hypothetical protein